MFENYLFPSTDAYMNREYRNGYFSQEGIEEAYKQIAVKILLPISQLFPTYPFKK